ncbi:hypothetical protein Fmac_015652 [Flemingia macrophylla]|uniref:Transmembrane protein n=1 Tax=Flemingia macrophylla TaxID=520843 RepID=A0ABD1MF54_9FABA
MPLDSKDAHGNGEYSDEYASSSKWRRDGGGGDKWNGSEEGSKKSKAVGDSKSSRRRDGSVGVYGEGEEVKRSSGKGDEKHRDSATRRSREGVAEKEKERKFGFTAKVGTNASIRHTIPPKIFVVLSVTALSRIARFAATKPIFTLVGTVTGVYFVKLAHTALFKAKVVEEKYRKPKKRDNDD